MRTVPAANILKHPSSIANISIRYIFPGKDYCASSPCHTNANCTNEVGSYSCKCLPGYTGDGIHSCASKIHFRQFAYSYYNDMWWKAIFGKSLPIGKVGMDLSIECEMLA